MCVRFDGSQRVNHVIFPIFYGAYKRQLVGIAIYEGPFETFQCCALFTSLSLYRRENGRALKKDKNAINVSAITDTFCH